ncbi:MAG: DNA mismatch repair protein MutS, partial [Phycisphaerae bacterium]
ARRQSDEFLAIDAAALRGLEIERTVRDGARDHTLLWAVDRTANPMGARRLREWLCFPLRSVAGIRARQDAVEFLRGDRARLHAVRGAMREMIDVERVIGRLGVGRAGPRDVAGLGRALRNGAAIAETLSPGGGPTLPAPLKRIAEAVGGWNELADYLSAALRDDAPPIQRDGGYIAEGFDEELDRLRSVQRDGHRWLGEFQSREAERCGIPSLKVGYNQVFGYYIEITNSHRDKAPPDYIRRQTVRNAERYVTEELKRHEDEVLSADERARQRESDLFEQVKSRVAEHVPRLQDTAAALAELDALAGFAELALERGYCRPEPLEAADDAPARIDIRDGRHPVLEQTLANRFVPNDCRVDPDSGALAVITGPNMAGKSTFIRQTALLTLLAQTGSYVPAASMRFTPVDRIFARIGASDEIARGQSTFMVEMVETAQILNNATPRSLVILDEIGRGTSTFDGLALAWAICEHLVRAIGCPVLFATHYHELTELAELLPGVQNLNVAVREHVGRDGREEVVFLHKILAGATDKSYGVYVARMAGIPPEVVSRSADVLVELQRGFSAESRTPAMRPRREPRRLADEPLLFPDDEQGPDSPSVG